MRRRGGGYDSAGRLDHVAGPGLPAGGGSAGARYTFDGGSGLMETLEFRDSGGTVKAWTGYGYEDTRDVTTVVENNFGTIGSPTLLSRYTYLYDNLARRSEVSYEGEAFAETHVDKWSYDDRNEVTGTRRYATTQPTTTQPATTQPGSGMHDGDRYYQYDPIGNRKVADEGWRYPFPPVIDPNDPNAPQDPNAGYITQATYIANNLNQYPRIFLESGPQIRMRYDADGNLIERLVFGDIDGDTDVDLTDLALMLAHIGDTCSSHAGLSDEQFFRADGVADCTLNVSDLAYVLANSGSAADTGNYVGYDWDAENRLVAVTPKIVNLTPGLKRLEFKYDYMGRRVEKLVFDVASTSWNANPTERRRFIWGSAPAGHGWLMLMEVIERDTDSPPDGDFDTVRTKRYTWGRDLSTQGSAGSYSCGTGIGPISCLTVAGGIGGLLALDDTNDPNDPNDTIAYGYVYDANGNVGQVVDWAESTAAASLKAQYEYDVYGNVTASSGDYADANTYRFSTKPWNDETGFGDWGRRHYDLRLGRWLNRDPIEESGGINLYVIVDNRPSGAVDALGKHSFSSIGQKFIPCLQKAAAQAKKEMDEIAKEFKIDPAHNGYKLWHCLNACHAWRMCRQKPPATIPNGMDHIPTQKELDEFLLWALRVGGVVYEIGTACGFNSPSLDGQPFRDWVLDTPLDLLANELGLIIGRIPFGLVSCKTGCRVVSEKIPGPRDIGTQQPGR